MLFTSLHLNFGEPHTAQYYNEAMTRCEDKGGHLLVLETKKKSKRVKKLFEKNIQLRNSSWIGLSRPAVSGGVQDGSPPWIWVNNVTLIWKNWNSTYFKRGDNYAYIDLLYDFKWRTVNGHDGDSNLTKPMYMCEIPTSRCVDDILTMTKYCTYVTVNAQNYRSARDFCWEKGGKLIQLETQNKSDSVQKVFDQLGMPISWSFWIGLLRLHGTHNGSYNWQDGTLLTWTNWNSDPYRTVDNYVHIEEGDNFRWRTVNDNITNSQNVMPAYMCEFPIAASQATDISKPTTTEATIPNGQQCTTASLCRVLDTPLNAYIRSSTAINQYSYQYPDLIRYVCNPGHKLVSGDLARVCLLNGKWSGEVAVCKRMSCGAPYTPINVQVINITGTWYGDMVTFNCQHGFQAVNGSFIRYCEEPGVWNNTQLICQEPEGCQDAPDVPHSDWRMYDGNMAIYTCHKGYNLMNTVTNKTCMGKRKQWSVQSPACLAEPTKYKLMRKQSQITAAHNNDMLAAIGFTQSDTEVLNFTLGSMVAIIFTTTIGTFFILADLSTLRKEWARMKMNMCGRKTTNRIENIK